jgi:hypothetical protein
MRKGGGHAKGSEFERKIAKDIVKAFKEFGVVQRDCWRSVLSGGHSMSSGDLEMTPRMEALFPWSVECKFHRKIDWWHFLIAETERKSAWKEWKWVSQAIDGAKKREGLSPLLVVKENRGPIFAAVVGPENYHLPLLVLWKQFLQDAVLRARGKKSA